MKKNHLVMALCTFSLCAATLTGCYVSVAPSVVPAEGAFSEPVAPTGKTIEPLPSALDPKAPDDCSFAAGFSSSAVAAGTDGAPAITLTVYDCDKFDLADVSQLASGDTIVIEGEEVALTTVEHGDIGVILNGGIEKDGFDLTTEEDGVYSPTTWDGLPVLHALGEVTLPLDEAFVFTDRSDLEGPELTYNAEAFMALEKDSETAYLPQATTVTVAGGKITAVTLDYMP